MRALPSLGLALGLSLALASCDDGTTPEPLLSTTLEGSYDGDAFSPINGFVTAGASGNSLIVVGDGPIACGSESGASPPRGYTAAFSIPTLAAGSYGSVSVQMIRNVSSYQGTGSNTGSVTITSVTDTTVAGQLSYSYTDSQSRVFTMTGSFEASRCAD